MLMDAHTHAHFEKNGVEMGMWAPQIWPKNVCPSVGIRLITNNQIKIFLIETSTVWRGTVPFMPMQIILTVLKNIGGRGDCQNGKEQACCFLNERSKYLNFAHVQLCPYVLTVILIGRGRGTAKMGTNGAMPLFGSQIPTFCNKLLDFDHQIFHES